MATGDNDNDVNGNGATGKEVDDDGNGAAGDDKDGDDNGNDDDDGDDKDDRDCDSAMGSSTTGYGGNDDDR